MPLDFSKLKITLQVCFLFKQTIIISNLCWILLTHVFMYFND